MPNKGQPIRSIQYPGLSVTATNLKRERSRIKLARWRKENPEKYLSQRRKWWTRNKEKFTQRAKEWRTANPEKMRRYRLRSHFKKNFGITLEQYDLIWEQQGKKCAICGVGDSFKDKFHLDHDHSTNVIRGILCARCNHGLGHFKDDASILHKAATYLDRGALSRTICRPTLGV